MRSSPGAFSKETFVKHARTLLYGGCFFFCLTLFVVFTQVIDSPSRGYSPQFSLRLQTESFLKGRLALQDYPAGARHDWCWGVRGCYQVWSLGVPLLRLPFEALAKCAGFVGAPDRWVFLCLYGGLILLWISTFDSFLRKENIAFGPHGVLPLAVILITCFSMVSPPLLSLIRARFGVYEEIVSYGIAWDLMLVVLLVSFWRAPSRASFIFLCVASGFAVLIRPTQCFYGSATCLLAFIRALRETWGKRVWLAGAALFLLFPLSLLFLNAWRYGSPVEFGYSLNMSGVVLNDYALRFGFPFSQAPQGAAAKELFSVLFLSPPVNIVDAYRPGFFLWQSNILRFHEFYSDTFNLPLFLGWMASMLFCLFRRLHPAVKEKGAAVRCSCVLSVWGFLSAAGLFAFYIRGPSLTSRYLLEFYPALMAPIVGGIVAMIDFVAQSRFRPFTILLVLICFGPWASWEVCALTRSYHSSLFQHIPVATQKEVEKALEKRFLDAASESAVRAVPDHYEIQGKAAETGILENTLGWAMGGDGTLDELSVVFLNASSCIELTLAPRDHPLDLSALRKIKVKSNILFLTLREVRPEGQNYILTFCSEHAPKEGGLPRMISIAWIPVEALGQRKPDFRLLKIRAVR